MNEKLKNILDTYDDSELAFLFKYKIDTYLEETKQSVQEYIKQRNLTETKINQLIKDVNKKNYNDNDKRCPRCKSLKTRTQEVELWRTNQYSPEAHDGLIGKATYKDEVVCNVCGYWIKDPNLTKPQKPTFWNKLWSVLD